MTTAERDLSSSSLVLFAPLAEARGSCVCAAERKRPGTCARLPSLDRRPDVTSALCLSSFFTPSTHTLALVALPRHGQGVPQVTQPTGASGDVLVLVSGAPRWAGPAHTHTLTKRRSVLPDSISDNSGNSSSEESNGERQHRALASAQETGASSASRDRCARESCGGRACYRAIARTYTMHNGRSTAAEVRGWGRARGRSRRIYSAA